MTAQLDVQVTSDLDLDKFGQPHVIRHVCEPLDQVVLGEHSVNVD